MENFVKTNYSPLSNKEYNSLMKKIDFVHNFFIKHPDFIPISIGITEVLLFFPHLNN